MWQYNYTHQDELYHWKRGPKKNHKYIARVPSGNGYRYFYSQDEYNAYLHPDKRSPFEKLGDNIKKNIKKNVDNVKTMAKTGGEALLKTAYKKILDGATPKVKSTMEAGAKFTNSLRNGTTSALQGKKLAEIGVSVLGRAFDKKINDAKNSVSNTASKTQQSVKETGNKIGDSIEKTADSYEKAKQTARENIGKAQKSIKDAGDKLGERIVKADEAYRNAKTNAKNAVKKGTETKEASRNQGASALADAWRRGATAAESSRNSQYSSTNDVANRAGKALGAASKELAKREGDAVLDSVEKRMEEALKKGRRFIDSL